MLEKMGLVRNGCYQEIKGIGAIFPQTYFSPYDYINFRKFFSENTYTLHHFYKSWLPKRTRIKANTKMILAILIGGNNIYRLRRIVSSRNG